jgi:hypothetical protein
LIFHSFTKKELTKTIDNQDFWSKRILPITPYRAFSHINSPTVDAEDVCLIIALDNDIVKGFIGILPDTIIINDNIKKIGVLSSWWVDKDAKGIGGILLLKAMKEFNGSVLAMHFSKQAANIYKKSGLFLPLAKQNGKVFFNKIDIKKRFINKYKNAKFFSIFLLILELIINSFYKIRIAIWTKNNKKFNNFEYTSFVNNEIINFINKNSKNELFYKDKNIFNWKLKYKWVISSPLKDRLSKKYRFSSVVSNFDFYPVKLYDNKSLVTFAIIRIRDNRMTVPYLYYKNDNHKDLVNIIGHLMILLDVNSLELYDDGLIDQLQKSNFPFLYKTLINKEIMISKSFKNYDFSSFKIQQGDGEGIYTY